MSCPHCKGAGRIVTVKDTHDDVAPCPDCTPELCNCQGSAARPHILITYRAAECPLCAALKGAPTQ